MNAYVVMVRREFWEHRVLWMAPLALAVLYVLLCLIPGVDLGGMNLDEHSRKANGPAIIAGTQLVFTMVLFGLMSIVVFFYLSDCLFAERKDRSILFWKSLPVSDAATVLTKLLVALLVVPLGVYLLAMASNVLAFGILYARFHNTSLGPLLKWDSQAWLRLNIYLLLDVVVLGLWYAPLAAYQLLISAWAKSSVFLWTVLPPIVLIVGEKFAFNTWHIAGIIGHRLGTGASTINAAGAGAQAHLGASMNVGGITESLNMLPLMGTVDMWIGVAVAVAFVVVTIRIRRFRDDS